MNRKFKIIFLLAVILLQTTVLSHFTPFSVVPNYTLVAVIAIAVISADSESVVLAALSGAVTDMLTGSPFGLNVLMYMYIAIVCAILSGSVYNKSARIVAPLCFTATFVYELLFGVFSTLLRNAVFDPMAIVSIVLPVAFINTVIFIPVYIVLGKVRLEKKKRGIKYER